MSFDYARSRASADRLIAKFGRPGTLRRPVAASGPSYDPTPGTPVDFAVTIAVIDYSDYEITGGRVLATDKKVLLAAGGLTEVPTPDHKLLIGTVWHNIIGPDRGRGIKPLAPAGVVVMYELQARK